MACSKPAQSDEDRVDSARAAGARGSVLLVDERPTGLRLMVGVLGRALQVTWTPDVGKALDLLARSRFDALVTSAQLFGQDGATGLARARQLRAGVALGLLTQIRSQASAARPVVLGADDLPALAADLRRLGAYDYLSPQLGDQQLVFRIRCALEDRPWADQVDGAALETGQAEPMV